MMTSAPLILFTGSFFTLVLRHSPFHFTHKFFTLTSHHSPPLTLLTSSSLCHHDIHLLTLLTSSLLCHHNNHLLTLLASSLLCHHKNRLLTLLTHSSSLTTFDFTHKLFYSQITTLTPLTLLISSAMSMEPCASAIISAVTPS